MSSEKNLAETVKYHEELIDKMDSVILKYVKEKDEIKSTRRKRHLSYGVFLASLAALLLIIFDLANSINGIGILNNVANVLKVTGILVGVAGLPFMYKMLYCGHKKYFSENCDLHEIDRRIKFLEDSISKHLSRIIDINKDNSINIAESNSKRRSELVNLKNTLVQKRIHEQNEVERYINNKKLVLTKKDNTNN